MKKLFWLAPILVAVFALVPQPAGATWMLTLGTGNMAIGGYPGPYADVAVTRTSSTTATVVFTSRVVGGNIYLFGDGGVVALNLNGTASWTATVGNSGTGFTTNAANLSGGGAGNEDGFGAFNFQLKNFDGFSYAYDTITLNLTKTDAGNWNNDHQVLTANAGGWSAAAHIFVTSSPADASNGALVTGYAGDGTAPPIPEPTSMLLLGLGLAGSGGLGFARRRRRK